MGCPYKAIADEASKQILEYLSEVVNVAGENSKYNFLFQTCYIKSPQ